MPLPRARSAFWEKESASLREEKRQTHTRTHARTHARTHTHIQTDWWNIFTRMTGEELWWRPVAYDNSVLPEVCASHRSRSFGKLREVELTPNQIKEKKYKRNGQEQTRTKQQQANKLKYTIRIHNVIYQCLVVASCPYLLPTIISLAAQQDPYKKRHLLTRKNNNN